MLRDLKIMGSDTDMSLISDPDPNPKSVRLSAPPPSSPSKRSRRSVQKREVSIPIQEAETSRAKGVSECAAPQSDSWAWRKYGQKPIKGSPYPRGYYRCSSSKGCPARKQVERSRADPTFLLVTYTCEHNHTSPPPPKNHSSTRHVPIKEEADPDPNPISPTPPELASDPDPEESRFSDLIIADDLWYSDVGSTSSTSHLTDTLLYGSVFVGPAELAAAEFEKIGEFKDDDEEDALFAGLGELPEYSTVIRRSYLDRAAPIHSAVHQ